MGKKKREIKRKGKPEEHGIDSAGKDDMFTRGRENLLLGILILYVLMLGLGTFGELFEVEWILNLPLFR